MEVLMSNWQSLQSLPESYVLPPEKRPGKAIVPMAQDIPLIDLHKTTGLKRSQTIHQIIEACQDFGFFQVINHGVSKTLMDEAMSVLKEFYSMPAEDKAEFVTGTRDKSCVLYTSSLNHDNNAEVRYWRDCFTHHCHPLQDHQQFWPQKPAKYREVVGKYSVEARDFLHTILDLISEGLGIEAGYFQGDLSKIQLLSVNHHIPCPDPSVTLGHPEHCDPNLITILHQCDVPGLQAFKDGQWSGVEPLPYAFVVILGVQLRVISNGKFKSPKHRVVTHQEDRRTTLGTFFIPWDDAIIEPAKPVLNESNPPLYKAYKYKEFFTGWTKHVKFAEEAALERFKL